MIEFFKKYSLDRPCPCHVLLFAVFPVLFLYGFNLQEMDVGDIFWPLAYSTAGAFLLWALLALLLRHGRKAGLATSLFVILFFSYGHIYDFGQQWNLFNAPHSRMIAGIVLAWVYFVYFIRFVRWDPRILTGVLNLAAGVLVAINLGRTALYEISRRPAAAKDESDYVMPVQSGDRGVLPDIYFIIFDEFAHPETMALYFEYDCSPFINELAGKGYYIADKSRTHVQDTIQVLASVLNMEHSTVSNEDKEQLYELIGFNKMASLLRSYGYRYTHFGSSYELGKWGRYVEQHADSYYNYYRDTTRDPVTEFQTILWQTTMLRTIYFSIVGEKYETYHRRAILNTLDHLQRKPEETGPKFVFAHIMLPHEPFVFGPQGEFVSPHNYSNYSDRRIYLGQYIYAAERILEIADALPNKSSSPPIIIIQSDHGLRQREGSGLNHEEGWKILNAIYLPGSGRVELYDSISPVNTLRLVFNHYFGTDYEPLPDVQITHDE
jgi:hypothetical protein